MKVEINNLTNREIVELKDVDRVLNRAIEIENLSNVLFNVVIVDNDYIHDLNKKYRNIDKETDVITFALEDGKNMVIAGIRVLGDIYISIEKAESQAKEYGHSLLRELSFLAVHGFYHLLGYDHMTEQEEHEMFAKQEFVLEQCSIER